MWVFILLLSIHSSLSATNSSVVSLNAVQTKILNQLLNIYILEGANEQCRNHSSILKQAVLNFEPWALKMIDSSSKMQSGLFEGNFMDFGSYTQCVQIRHETYEIKGKHCLIKAQIGTKILKKLLTIGELSLSHFDNVQRMVNNSVFNWAICVPDTCDKIDIKKSFGNFLNDIFNGIDVELQEIQCSTNDISLMPYSFAELTVLYLFGFIIVLEIFCTILDLYKRSRNLPTGIEAILSIYSNSVHLFSQSDSHKSTKCLNGLRVLSFALVVIGHRFLLLIIFQIQNPTDMLNILPNYECTIIDGTPISVDTFLLLSGLLLTYHYLIYHSKGGKFSLVNYIVYRYFRITGPYLVVITVVGLFSHRFASGPIWEQTVEQIQKPCQKYWWSALLYVQSFVNPTEICILQSWYLSIDQLYYVFAPILLITLIRNRFLGVFCMWMLFWISLLWNFHLAYVNQYPIEGLMDRNLLTSSYFVEYYIQPHIRASPYLLGMLLGYKLFESRNKKVFISRAKLICGWVTSTSILLLVLLAHRWFNLYDYVYEPFEAALYHAVHRSLWVSAVAWIIWACVHGYGGPVNTFLSNSFFEVAGRLTYAAFLVHLPFQFFQNGASKNPIYFDETSSILTLFSDAGLSYFLGYFLTVLVEYPVCRFSENFFKNRAVTKLEVKQQ